MAEIPCPCPPRAGREEPPHDVDTVEFKPRLGFVEASAVRNRIALRRSVGEEDLEADEVLAALTEGYILYGITSWTLVDAKGEPLPVTKANIRERILDNPDQWEAATALADEADGLYAEAVMLPLLRTASTSSQPSQTDDSTSPSPSSGKAPRKPSKPSSISTIPTADTATTTSSPDGDSRSSQSSTTAA